MNAKSQMRALQGVRAGRTDEWYRRQLAHALACIAEADKQHTPEEIAAAEAALAVDPRSPQDNLFNAPPHAGVATSGQPEPCGLAGAPIQGARRSHANF